MKDSYDDIIHLPHHVSSTHPQMSAADRAAQFSPFAPLTGYGDIIAETSRFTDTRAELEEDLQEELGRKLRFLADHIHESPRVTVTYFQPDSRKEGGTYHTICCTVTNVDPSVQILRTEEGLELPFAALQSVEGNCFQNGPER